MWTTPAHLLNIQVFNSCHSDNRKINKALTFNSSFIIYTQHPLVKNRSMSAKVTIDFTDNKVQVQCVII